jgi:hypothetical protein
MGSDPYNAQPASARILRATLAQVYAQAETTIVSTYFSTRPQIVTPTTTYEGDTATSQRAESGTWNAYSSGAQAPKTRYSSVTSSKVTYTVTGATNILWRFFCNSSNAGVANVVIKQAGVEIATNQYLAGLSGGNRVVNQKYISSSFNNTNFGYAPLAQLLNPALTYTVEITHASGTRMYDSGLQFYSDSTYDGYPTRAPAYDWTGTWDTYSFAGGNTYAASLFAGSRAVLTCANTTRVLLKYCKRPNGAYMGVKIFNSSGAEIDTSKYQNVSTHANGFRYIDTYAATPAEATVQVADGLPKDTYYIHVWSLGERSTAFTETTTGGSLSSQWAIYIYSAVGYDTTTGANVTDQSMYQRSDLQLQGGGSDPTDVAGNMIFAGQFRDSSDGNFTTDVANAMFVTGTHGAEGLPTNLVVTMDGVEQDWAGAANNSQWLNVLDLTVEFDTLVYTQTNPTTNAIGTLHYKYVFTPGKVIVTYTFTTTRNIYYGTVYAGLFNVPNGNAVGTVKLDDGLNKLKTGADFTTLNAYDNAIANLANYSGTACFVNGTTAWSYQIVGGADTSIVNSVTSRTRTNKVYFKQRADTSGNTTGTLVTSGFTLSAQITMRPFYGRDYAAALGV